MSTTKLFTAVLNLRRLKAQVTGSERGMLNGAVVKNKNNFY